MRRRDAESPREQAEDPARTDGGPRRLGGGHLGHHVEFVNETLAVSINDGVSEHDTRFAYSTIRDKPIFPNDSSA